MITLKEKYSVILRGTIIHSNNRMMLGACNNLAKLDFINKNSKRNSKKNLKKTS